MSNVRIQDDLYEAVNGEWLKTAVIPDDRPTTGGFVDLDEGVEKKLMKDFREMSEGSKEIPDITGMKDAVELYRKVLDTKRLDQDGIQPVLDTLARIQAIKTPEQLNAQAKEVLLAGIDLPVNIAVSPDMKNAEVYSMAVWGPDLILPDTTYYAEDNANGKKLLAVYRDMAAKALAYTSLSKREQEEYLNDTLAFDRLVSGKVKSQLEWADYVNDYNPMNLDEVAQYTGLFDIRGLLKQLYGDKLPETLVVRDPKAVRELNTYYSAQTFSLYIHWAYVKKLIRSLHTLSLELAGIGTEYRRALMGTAKDPEREKLAYRAASAAFSEPVGIYYGRTYFGEEAKKDVVSLVRKIIDTYKDRMRKNTFLKESTREKAISKLSTITIKMGYPDAVHDLYKQMIVDPEETYYATSQKLNRIVLQDSLHKLGQKVDKSEWAMPGHMVNACYDPSNNDITFPAAILQKPFYSLDQSVSANLGGIGAVIGHEISHAFDNNGAHFDEHGNLFDWWTKEDYAAFQEKTKSMIEEFDGIPFHGGKVNGQLVVSENIADNGGMAVTLQIMREQKDPDYASYFENWGRIWCRKAREEYIQYLLVNDVHSPAELRANMQPRNFSEWYETFDVKPGDGMYLAPEKRVTIW